MREESNKFRLDFSSRADNVPIARVFVASVAALQDITVGQLDEIKVAVSEAVSNAIIHGYDNDCSQTVTIELELFEGLLEISVSDRGVGIADIDLAMQPGYSGNGQRMGLGFAFMQSFSDSLQVESEPGQGTRVRMSKNLIALNNPLLGNLGNIG